MFVGGTWRERTAFLRLRQGVDGEIREDHEQVDEVGGGGLAADAVAGGNALSG
ncbi:hypothetical protein D3C72_2222060 [compost metagenome]